MVCPERATRPARLTRGVMISSSTINTTAAYIGGLGLCSTAVTTCMLHPVFLGDASLKRGVGISPLAASFFLVPTLPSAALAVDRCKCTTSVHLSFSFPVTNLPVIRHLVGRTTTILPYRDGGLRFGTYLSPPPPVTLTYSPAQKTTPPLPRFGRATFSGFIGFTVGLRLLRRVGAMFGDLPFASTC